MSQVGRNNDLCAGTYGRRENVAIIGIGQLESLDERLEALDQTVGYCGNYELPEAIEPIDRNVRPRRASALSISSRI